MSEFKNRLEGFEDIIPIQQDEGPNPVARIDYSSEYVALMNTFRGIVSIGERSRRVYNLIERILDHNAANYTLWHYRRDIIRFLMDEYVNKTSILSTTNIIEEIIFMDKFSYDNPKNYQIWYHRRALVEIMLSYNIYNNPESIPTIASKELQFCTIVCDTDNKNYHAWSHRQWILKLFNYWDGEIQYIERMLITDCRNNSAWNQRWFVIHNSNVNNEVSHEALLSELKYTTESIRSVKFNESSWNYLRGLANKHDIIKNDITAFCTNLVNDTDFNNHFAIALLADLKEQQKTIESLQESEQLYIHLSVIDPIRKKVWNKRAEQIRLLLLSLSK